MLHDRCTLPFYLHRDLCEHEWRPGGGPCTGLPADPDEVRKRGAERCVAEPVDASTVGNAPVAPETALTERCLDLRRLDTARRMLRP